ncbi:MAG: acetyl-CoA C-acetyltransferase [Lewinellaceae bacterium]|nr:acetyl-CoA C-acetyltransferase [Lewinellaceae bacterium]
MPEAYIYDSLRTPRGRGKSRGALYEVKPMDLLAAAVRALRQRTALPPEELDDAVIGCVTPIGDQGYNIAKAALLHAGWGNSVSGMQVNRYCASGLEAINLAAMKVRSGWEELVLAGGVESMSRIPIGSDGGPLMYDPELITRANSIPQGVSADLIATLEGFSREELDACAYHSHQRARHAWENGYFNRSIIPIYDRNGLLILDKDEHIRPNTTLDALSKLPPAFASAGWEGFDEMALHAFPELEGIRHLHTAGNSSGIVDGAALALVGSKEKGEALGLKPRARILAAATVSVDPTLMLTGPAPAARKALKQAGMKSGDVDLWECNEAFASVVLKFRREMEVDDAIINVNGGAIAMGHPLGATGAMLLGTLLDEMERQDKATGLVTLCVGGGMGVATVIERV